MRVVDRLPLGNDVDPVERQRVVHDEVARVVVRPDLLLRRVGPVAVDVERDQERVVAAVPVDGLDEEVVALGRGDAQHVRVLLLDVGRIVHDDAHRVRVEVYHGRGEGGEADHADAVRLALDEADARTEALVDDDAVGDGRGKVGI